MTEYTTSGRDLRVDRQVSGQRAVDVFAIKPIASGLPFFVFLVYMTSFYLHIPARFPAIAKARPDMLLAIVLLCLLIPTFKYKTELFRHPVSKALAALIAAAIISLPFTEWPGSVVRYHMDAFIKATLFFYFTVLTVDTPRRLRTFVWLFVACQVFRVLEPLYLNITEGYMGGATYIGSGQFAGRLNGAPADVINPNGLGFVIATITVFVHFFWWQSKHLFSKLLYLVCVPAMLYALILTMSRGGFLALLVGGWIVFRQSSQKPVLVVVAIAVGLGGWSVMSDIQKDRYLSLVSSDARQSGTVQGRFSGMLGELRVGLNRPIFGHGVGTTGEAKGNFGAGYEASHNLYAQLVIEMGVLGFVIFITYMLRIYRTVASNVENLMKVEASSDQAEFYGRLGRGLSALFWVYAVYSFNYFGLSQDYWYVLGGLSVAFGVLLQQAAGTQGAVPASNTVARK